MIRFGKLKKLLARALKKFYPRFGLRDSDIILASYPKSGNTWMRFIWANMISLLDLGGRAIDFHFIDEELAAEYDSHAYGNLRFSSLPRLVKTHREFDERFERNRTVYLYRNPGDTMLSYYEYILSQRSSGIEDVPLSEFIRHPEFGMPAWCRHVASWIGDCDISIRYESMQDDTLEVVVDILKEFELTHVDEEIVKKAVERSSFDSMRSVEERRGRPSLEDGRFSDDYRFTNKGRYGEWQGRFLSRDIEYMKDLLSDWGLFEGQLWGQRQDRG